MVDFITYKCDGFQAFGYDSQLQAHLKMNMEMVIQTTCLSAGCLSESCGMPYQADYVDI